MNDIQTQALVIDNGSGVLKAGLAGENNPSIKFASIVGYPKHSALVGVDTGKSEYVGDEALKLKGILNLKNPIANGIVQDWEEMQKIWQYAFDNEFRVDPTEHNIMMTEAPGNPRANREKMCEIMFETFNTKGFYVAIQAVLSLYANGRTTGLVLDSGDGVTHAVPVFEGFSIPHAIKKNYIAGRSITEHMEKLLNNDSICQGNNGKSTWQQLCRNIKEQCCFVSLDPQADMKKASESSEINMSHEMPDGSIVNINSPRFMAPEGLFDPTLIREGTEDVGMHFLAQQSIKECDIDVRSELYGNIILSGGSTLYQGLPDRVLQEIDALAPKQGITKVIALDDRYYSVWQGGSVLSSLATFESSWITKEEYEENGHDIIHRKCV